MGWLRTVIAVLSRIRHPRRWRLAGEVLAADEIPSRISARRAILVGDLATPKWLALDCPCETGHRLMLNLDPARHPAWKLLAGDPLSLHPSVDAHGGPRRCHFFIRNGKISWIPDQAVSP